MSDGMRQNYRSSLCQRPHFSPQAAKTGGLDFVDHAITNYVGNESSKGNFRLTIVTQVI